jgi:23S rRNA (adenine2503-C2)-methyltransferase
LGRTLAGFIADCAGEGLNEARAREAYRGFYAKGDAAVLPEAVDPWVAPIVRSMREEVSEGTTIKFCQRLDRRTGAPASARRADGLALGVLGQDDRVRHLDIESVVIPMIGRTQRKTHTLCVSSQIGCAMGCGFCETAQMGLIRSLTPAEIVAQWWAATHRVLAAETTADGDRARIDNIVFMGMGEPLDNLDAVIEAIACLTEHNGPAVPMSAITISTVGRVDGLRRLIEIVQQTGWKRLGIALSVNAPNDAVRDSIMPLNKRYNMAELRAVMEELMRVRGTRKILFEYVLIPGVNDADEHADELASWLSPFGPREGRSALGLLNIIPYNPRRDSPWPAPEEPDVERFVSRMNGLGVYTKRRRTKGRSQMAACGQLGTAEIRGRRYLSHTPGDATPRAVTDADSGAGSSGAGSSGVGHG